MSESDLDTKLTELFHTRYLTEPDRQYNVKELVNLLSSSHSNIDKSTVNRSLYSLLRKRILTKEGDTPPLWRLREPPSKLSSSTHLSSSNNESQHSSSSSSSTTTSSSFSDLASSPQSKKLKRDNNDNNSSSTPHQPSSSSSASLESDNIHHQLICVDLETTPSSILSFLYHFVHQSQSPQPSMPITISSVLSSSSNVPNILIKPRLIGFCNANYDQNQSVQYSTTAAASTVSSIVSSTSSTTTLSLSTIFSQILPSRTNYSNSSMILMGMTLGGLLTLGKLNKYSSIYIISSTNDNNNMENTIIEELKYQLSSINSSIIIQHCLPIEQDIQNTILVTKK